MNTLYNLKISQIATIHSFNRSYSSITRLSEMGIVPGTIIRLVKKNPFGGPLQIKFNNNYIAIRKKDALMINIVY